jgi:AcrR family transcriptional regulator
MGTRPRAAALQTQVPTRDLLLDEAERLIAKDGVNGFTLKDVVARIGVQVPAIYKHYKSRDDVLIALCRRYIQELSRHFSYPSEALDNPVATLKTLVAEYTRFHITNPAYVRLALVDFATPDGGMEYLRLAAGGTFHDNVSKGPVAEMQRRLGKLLRAGHRQGELRMLPPIDFFRVVKGALLLRLVFPDDVLIDPAPSRELIRAIETWVWDIAYRYTARKAGPVRASRDTKLRRPTPIAVSIQPERD